MRNRYAARFLPCLLLVWALLPGWAAHAQSGKRTLTGYVTVSGQGPSTYYVSYTQKGNNISGYTITDFKNNSSLKASMVGTLDRNGNLYIRETGSMDGPSVGGLTSNYCYFTGTLKLVEKNGRKYYTGPYTSHSPSGAPCGSGIMTLNDVTPPPPPVAPKPRVTPPPAPRVRPTLRAMPPDRQLRKPADTTPKPKPAPPAVVADTTPKPKPAPVVAADTTPKPAPPVVVVTPDPPKPPVVAPKPPAEDSLPVTPLYMWNTDSVVVEVWDGYDEDGDVISLLVDGHPVVENYNLLINGKRRIAFYLPDYRTHMLEIQLLGTGKQWPATPNLRFTDGTRQYLLDVSGNKGDVGKIYFRKKKVP